MRESSGCHLSSSSISPTTGVSQFPAGSHGLSPLHLFFLPNLSIK